MTPAPAPQQNSHPTQQNSHPDTQHSHPDTQHSNASTDPSNFHQRPTFKTRNTHPCITIRRAAKGGQTRHAELISRKDRQGMVGAGREVGSC
jgi:hypothetical protein